MKNGLFKKVSNCLKDGRFTAPGPIFEIANEAGQNGRKTLEAFLKTANSFHSTIRFTAEVSNDKHVFLDTMSHLVDDKVAVDLYTKPTDSHQYLLPTSCHPPHCSKNIPYSLALRIRRICSDDETFEKRVKDLSEQLKNRGY